MSLLIRCDTCGCTVPKPGRMPPDWNSHAQYTGRGTRKKFDRMKHTCPNCPQEIPRPDIEESIPVLTAEQGLLEVEEAARFAMMDEEELTGSARRMVVRALAILDAARERLGPKPPGDDS